jgi:hypothetical protein
MSPAIFQSDITNALKKSDYLVWTYSDANDYLTPGGVAQGWIDAIWNARTAAGLPVPGSTPTPTPVVPLISNVQVSYVTRTSAILSWNVSPDSTGQVEYGVTIVYGSFTTLETNHLSSHRQNVSGLRSGTLYHYRILGTDVSGGNVVLVDRKFETAH